MRKSITINGKLVTKYFKTVIDRDIWIKSVSDVLSDQSLDGEVWASIPNFSRYEASNLGRLRSLNYKNSGITKIITPSKSCDGYLKTMLLRDDNKYKSWTAHLFVCLTFYGVKPYGMEINHKDGDKTNNNVSNLEYCTHSENCKHSFDTGLQLPKNGYLNGMAKLTIPQVLEARNAKNTNGRYWGRNEMAKEFGISAKQLQKIVNNTDKSWSNV